MNRNEVELKYKWDLESIYPTDEDWEKDFATTKSELSLIENYKGKLSDKKALRECFDLSIKTERALMKLYAYAHMRSDENSANDFYSAMTDRCVQLFAQYSANGSFISPELSSQKTEYLLDLVNDEQFSDHDYVISELIRSKEHILSEKEERILALSSVPNGYFHEIFNKADNVDLPFGYVTIDGKREKLTHGKYGFYLQHRDQKVREKVFKSYYASYKKIINILATTYTGSVKADNFVAKAKGYSSARQKAMFDENVPEVVYDNLIEIVHRYQPVMHRYMALRKKMLGFKKYNMFDMFVSIADTDLSVKYEQAYEMVLKGLAPMGEEYISLLKRARDERWIDVFETDNKRSGAYSSGSFDTKPFVLLNYADTAHDVFTIAHELGHSIHSYYSRTTQPYPKANYEIFVAEVASTVNEVLLLKDLISSTTDKQFKKYLLAYYLDMFRTTVFRQAQFAEFEDLAHKMDDDGEALTVTNLSEKYYALNKQYYGDAVTHNSEIAYEWARIPHFYSAFYVYKYATGLTSAVAIAKKILTDDKYFDSYKKFLCAGSSTSPYEILKYTGVDLATKEPFEMAMKEFEDTLKQLEAMDEED